MDSDFPKSEVSLTEQESQGKTISRRSMLEIVAKSAAGLAITPMAVILADEQKEVMMSELLDGNSEATASADKGLFGYNSASSSASSLVGDINRDGIVDEEDLKIMSDEWLSSDERALSNLDGSYSYIQGSASSAVYVDSRDYSMLANNWGKRSSASGSVNFLRVRKSSQDICKLIDKISKA
ncbi:MAG TPA: hypothetical protein PLP05_04235 [Sedimentisphaerales bacterium]|nr:hypothetical protein [Sedimentisphaerales bacterium]